MEGIGESEGIELWTWLSDDLERSLIPGRQLMRGLSCLEVLHQNKDFLSNFE